MKGIVKVVSDTEDSTAALSVTMEDIPAVQQVKEDTDTIAFNNCVLNGSMFDSYC